MDFAQLECAKFAPGGGTATFTSQDPWVSQRTWITLILAFTRINGWLPDCSSTSRSTKINRSVPKRRSAGSRLRQAVAGKYFAGEGQLTLPAEGGV